MKNITTGLVKDVPRRLTSQNAWFPWVALFCGCYGTSGMWSLGVGSKSLEMGVGVYSLTHISPVCLLPGS